MGLQIGEIVPRKDVTFEDLKGKIIAVDAFNALYQFLSTIRQPDGTPLMDSKKRITSHLSGLFYRTTNLMAKGLKLVFVFDGIPPEMKYGTHEKRAAVKEKARFEYEKAKKLGEEENMGKYARQFSTLSEEMIKESKELIEALGLTVVQAPGEGEAQASFMAHKKDVYAIASQDYDSLLFNAPRLIQNLTLARKRKLASGAFIIIKPEMIDLDNVLQELNLTHDQLICLGILCGTDYNPGGIKGIGPKTALKLIKEHKTPKELFASIEKDKQIEFDWEKIFELFKKPDVTSEYDIKFKKPDEQAIKNLLVKKHEFNEERIDSALQKIGKMQEEAKQTGLNKFF